MIFKKVLNEKFLDNKNMIINATVEVDDDEQKEREKRREDNLKEFSTMLKNQEEINKEPDLKLCKKLFSNRKELSKFLVSLKESNIKFNVRRNLSEDVEGKYIVSYYQLNEALKEQDKDNDIPFEDFLANAEVLIVDDAKTFNINQWEKENEEEINEELGREFSTLEKPESKFIKYKLEGDKLQQVLDKLKTSDFSIVDERTSWKTRQFLKKKNLTLEDLKDVLRNLQSSDYKTNSKPINTNEGYNEAIIFIKNAKIKELDSMPLYIKLDYDSIEDTPVIIISLHNDYKKKEAPEESKEDKLEVKDIKNIAELKDEDKVVVVGKDMKKEESNLETIKELKESISQSITIYEKDRDGVPEIGREFIAYASGHRKYGIFKRVDKSKWEKESDAKDHISSDDEFYAEVEHGWIYGIDFDSYAYVDELGLKSSKVTQKETGENETKKTEALNAFKKVFGDKYAEKVLNAFSTMKNNRFEVVLPFSVYKGNLDINQYSVCDHDDCSVFIKMMTKKGFTETEAKDLLKLVVDYNWADSYTNERMKGIKETSNLNKILNNNANESYNKEFKEDVEEVEEPKLDTFEEQMDFLAKDEQEAIDGYEKVLALVEDEHVKEQLNKILIEEKAHKEFLEKVKEDKELVYEEPLPVEEEKPEEKEEIIDEVKLEESLKELLEEAKEEAKRNFNIDVEVLVESNIDEDIVSGNAEEKYDDQTLEDWYDFASNVEGLIEKVGTIVNVSQSRQSLSQYIDFYTKDKDGNNLTGLVDLRLSDHKSTSNARAYRLVSVIVNGKYFESYEEALVYIENLLKNIANEKLKESIKEDLDKETIYIKYWEDEELRDQGISEIYLDKFESVEDAKEVARKLVDRDGYASVEVFISPKGEIESADDKLVWGYDGIDTWTESLEKKNINEDDISLTEDVHIDINKDTVTITEDGTEDVVVCNLNKYEEQEEAKVDDEEIEDDISWLTSTDMKESLNTNNKTNWNFDDEDNYVPTEADIAENMEDFNLYEDTK